MSRLTESMREAAQTVAQTSAAHHANRRAHLEGRPRLTAGTIFQSLDWVLDNADQLENAALYMQAIELGIRVMTTEAQGKATQHTLVDEGKIAAPPAA